MATSAAERLFWEIGVFDENFQIGIVTLPKERLGALLLKNELPFSCRKCQSIQQA
jgi:hypothetical protein